MNNITILEKDKCNGCSACYNVCPVKAITMQENKEGFLYPQIDNDKCTNCGLCVKSCSALNTKYLNNKNPNCYAYMAPDDIRLKSASGGVFAMLAKYFIQNEGYICGAVWNNEWQVEHIVSNSMQDIEKMQSSKYVQSNIKNCYCEIKTLLNNGKNVLFSGTPCQVAGLKSYLGKTYSNLFCVDIICHGVPSPKVFRKYLNENFNVKELTSINFRPKQLYGWCCKIMELKTINKTINKTEYYEMFLKNVLHRKNCYTCQFNKLPRQGDITIGDFWGIKKKYNDRKGTSVILLNNNDKGKQLFNILEKEAKLMKKMPLKKAIKRNENIIQPSQLHKNRDEFYKNIDRMSMNESIKYVLKDKCDCMILSLWSTVNFGAALTSLGVKCLVEKLGYSAKTINYVPELGRGYKNSFSEKFGKKYLNLTNEIENYNDLIELNRYCKNFIVGSDQLWNDYVMRTHHDRLTEFIYLLDFVQNGSKRISYATSFGNNHDLTKKELFKHFYSQFNAISVRENYATEILKSDYNIDSKTLIDGAFHIPQNLLNTMTNEYDNCYKDSEYCLYFNLKNFNYPWQRNIANKISEKLGLPLKIVNIDNNMLVEEWLSLIKNAKFVMSNSYHAIVFAIRFNVPFVQLASANAQDRFEMLFEFLNTPNNSIFEFDTNLDFEKIFVDRNWNDINSKIEFKIQEAEEWLKKELEQPTIDNSNHDIINYLIRQQLLNNEKEHLLKNRKKTIFKYYKYKLLSNIVFGKKKRRYKNKAKAIKIQCGIIKKVYKENKKKNRDFLLDFIVQYNTPQNPCDS